MRAIYTALAVLALAAASAQADVTANDFVDTLLERFSASERISSLPDIKEESDINVLFWDTTVSIEANNGAPVGDVTLRRFSDAVLSVDAVGNLALTAEIGFDEAECSYEYKTRLGKVKGPSGRFTAKVGTTTMTATIKLFISSLECRVAATTITIGELGDIVLEKGGSTIANDVYRKLLVDMLEKNRRSALQQIIDVEISSLGWDCDYLLPAGVAKAAQAAKALAPSA